MFFFKNFRYQYFVKIKLRQRGLKNIYLREFSETTKKKSYVETKQNVVSYGQPTSSTHPHIIKNGDLVLGVTLAEFMERRERVMHGIQRYANEHLKNVPQTENGHLLIIPSSTKKYMTEKIPYVFRQNSDFYYLSGCLEPDTVLMLSIDKLGAVKSRLFLRPKDKHAELWDGSRTGVENALDLFGVNEAYSIDQFKRELENLYTKENFFLWYDSKRSELPDITDAVHKATGVAPPTNSGTNFIHGMRVFKSSAEQELMRRSCHIASVSINEVMQESHPGYTEHQIFAMIDYKCRMRNASYLAYPPVVASGTNSTTIHYISNQQQVKSGDLVLLDAGCEYGGYSSDITRTWPITRHFSEPQKVLYDVVLSLQKDLLAIIQKEGGETLDDLFDTMCIKLGKYLQEVGLVPKGISDTNSYSKAGYSFCPHHVSHYLGMDVHDTALIPRNLPIKPGMVFTVEPGIYIAQDRSDVPKEFRGIGIRIEDDVLVTEKNGIEILTRHCLKERSDLQKFF